MKLRSLLRRTRVEREMDDELRFHLEARAEDLARSHGVSPDAAMRRARVEFGSVQKFKDEERQALGLRLVDEFAADLRFAARMFARQKMFAATAVVTLAVGIGANAAVFGALDALRFRKLAVERPDELVVFASLTGPDSMVAGYSGRSSRGSNGTLRRASFSMVTFERFREHSSTLSHVIAINGFSPPFNVVVDGQADVAPSGLVSGNYFTGLGVKAAAGRLLEPADDLEAAEPAAVISYGYWQRQFQGRHDAVGTRMSINRVPFTIVGVTPESFHGTEMQAGPAITVPLAMSARLSPTGRPRPASVWWVEMMGRMKPGVTRDLVRAELTTMFADTVRASWDARPRVPDEPPATKSGVPQLLVDSGARGRHADNVMPTDPLAIAFAIVGLMLLIGCANLATLLLARAAGRRDEVAMRLALGASRRRVVRQFLTESLFLALVGGAAGALLAFWSKPLVMWLLDTTVDVRIDARVLAFTIALSACAAMIVGIAPALRATWMGAGPFLRMSGQKGGALRGLSGRVLMGAQVALTLVLLVGAGLLARTLYNYSRVDVGFDTRNLLVFDVSPGPRAQQPLLASGEFYPRLISAIEGVPGVEGATMSAIPLVGQAEWSEGVRPAGRDRKVNAFIQIVHWNFFDTIGMKVVAGRTLAATDVPGAPRVAVINETMARQLFEAPAPVGEHFQLVSGVERDTLVEVVGIVRDARYAHLEEPAPPTFYQPHAQVPPASNLNPSRMTFEVRTVGEPLSFVPQVRTAVRSVDPDLPLVQVRTQESQIAETTRESRAFAILAAFAALVGVLLACIGLYGVVAHDVSRRTVEIGIRMALGARTWDVVFLVIRQILGVVAIGAVVGLVLSRTASPLVQELLFDVAPGDLVTLSVAAVLLVTVSVLAAYLPARKAARLEPTRALRIG